MSSTSTNYIAYRPPGSSKVQRYFATEIAEREEADFCIRSFTGEPAWFKKTTETGIAKPLDLFHSGQPPQTAVNENVYKKQVDEISTAIRSSKLNKVVLSRVKTLNFKLNLQTYFDALCKAYPHAFVCLTQTQYGTWIGASPEVLLKQHEDGTLSTYSLAGTRWKTNDTQTSWTEKEKEEQAWVSREIQEAFDSNSITYKESPVETIETGNLLHLKSTFQSQKPVTDASFWTLAKALHPTPAVAGSPRKMAIEKITSVEAHSRQLYTGFWGPIGDQHKQLFVNLRCMQVFKDKLFIYVGGGITYDSDPQREWEETEQKAKNLIQPLYANS